jgi:hypothetical protein
VAFAALAGPLLPRSVLMKVLSRFGFITGCYTCPALAANRPALSNSVLRRNRLSSTVCSLAHSFHNECCSRCCSEHRYMGKGHLNACATFTVLLKGPPAVHGPQFAIVQLLDRHAVSTTVPGLAHGCGVSMLASTQASRAQWCKLRCIAPPTLSDVLSPTSLAVLTVPSAPTPTPLL